MMDLKAELLFDLSLNLDRANTQDVGAGPHGHRRIVPVLGGSFAGPKLKGKVLPIGADWLLNRPLVFAKPLLDNPRLERI